jgi:hypothetical protein
MFDAVPAMLNPRVSDDPAHTGEPRGAADESYATAYDEEYFRSHLGPLPYDRNNTQLVHFFATVADQVIRCLQPRTVLDAGCAMGFLVEALWDRGIQAHGIDVSSYAISNVRRDIRPYCRVASLTDPIEGAYDVVTCIEVLEHMPEIDALAAIDHLTAVTDTILFSSSPTDVDETTHVNVRQPIWWLQQFQQRGFAPDLVFDAGFITPAAMLLRRSRTQYDWQVLRLFSEWLRYKSAVVARDQTIARLTEANGNAEARNAALTSERDAAIAEAARRQVEAASMKAERDAASAAAEDRKAEADAARAERDAALIEVAQRKQEETEMKAEMARIAEAVSTIQTQQGMLVSRVDAFDEFATTRPQAEDATRLSEILTTTQTELESLVSRHQVLLTTLDRMSRERDALEARLEENADRTAPVASAGVLVADDPRLSDLAGQFNALRRGQEMLLQHVSALTTQVNGILTSRIWRSLAAAGGVVLRCVPGSRR